jgi:hypothetical protein
MPDRVSKTSSVKSAQRASLAAVIAETGSDVMPCTACFRGKRVCRMSDHSSRCLECVKRGRSCDGVSVFFFSSDPYC